MTTLTYDIAVIGGGPAGMMAAGRAAEKGARVLLIEKNKELGKKLLITGGGRCNITNAEFTTRALAARYGDKGKFLLSPFSQFNSQNTFTFFESRGLTLKIEAEKRAFPITNKAQSVFDVLTKYLTQGNVTLLTDSAVLSFITESGKIVAAITKKHTIVAKKFIIATGGKSRPETGSTGDGFSWLTSLGHTVTEPEAALVPIKIKDQWVKDLQGLSLTDIRLSSYDNGTRQDSRIGKILFTHFGISGPLVLNMSKDIRELREYGDVTLSLDLFPTLNHQELDKKLQELWKIDQNKFFKNSLASFVPPKIAPILVSLSGINQDKFVNKVSREERLSIIKLVKDMKMSVEGFLGVEKAIVTSGGVSLEEVDFKTMQSKKIDNLYLVGDILDFDRPSGGFSLQICWTTGYIAGESAACV